MAKQITYYVKGMHCASCEILLEKKLLETEGVRSVEASTNKGEINIYFDGEKPSVEKLNHIFKREGYSFFESKQSGNGNKSNSTLVAFNIAIFVIILFLILDKFGISGLLNVGSTSSLFAFLGLGLLAGISSCAALVGGMVLSMSKQWQSLYGENDGFSKKLQPHLMFNAGRLISYAFFGAVLGAIGSKLQISFQFTSFLVIAISLLMIALGLQMLGLKAFRKFQFTLPKSLTRNIVDEKKFQGKQMPFLMGALTFFLPCGFTITAQGLALISGSALQGSLIMLFFALGTVPMLLFIGISSVRASLKPHLAERFSKVAGFLVLFFALININSQLNVLGFSSLSNLSIKTNQTQNTVEDKSLPPIVDGKQIVKMNASSKGYDPNYIKIRVGIPVRWEITDIGTSGCTNAVISKSLFEGQIDLTPGQTSVKEFTPTTVGKFKFSCWMGMVTGIMEVVDLGKTTKADTNATVADNTVVASGSTSCGCGGNSGSGSRSCGGSCGGGCGGGKTNATQNTTGSSCH